MFAAILNQMTSHHPGLSKDLIAVAITSRVGTGPPKRIQELLRKTAEELPILSQSCRSIIACTDDDTSSANDVSEIIKHDQAFLAKVIKLANSATYYGPEPVVSSLQAVKIIGFDIIRAAAIGAEFVERTDGRGGDSAVLKKLLVRAVVSATAAQELEEACKFPRNPNLFTCTMLYTLGDLVLAHFLPDIYRILEAAQFHEPERIHKLETKLLGQTFQRLATKMAKKLGLPIKITTLIETKPNLSQQQWTTTHDRLTGLVCAANELGNCLLSPPTPSVQASLQELLARFPQALNISPQALKTLTIKAFLKADQLSGIMKIEKKYFVPHSDWGILDPAANPIKDFIGGIRNATDTYQDVNLNTKTVLST